MKYVLGIVASALMIWSLLDKEDNEYKIYVQVLALLLFFYVMMRLMNKTPSKKQDASKDNFIENKDKNKDEGLE